MPSVLLQVPCLLNILGAILYLRIGVSVGMMGMVGTLGIFGVSQGIAYLTISSFSAIVTNGRMKGGGAYYMISRNLGPAFGGSRCGHITCRFPSALATIGRQLRARVPTKC